MKNIFALCLFGVMSNTVYSQTPYIKDDNRNWKMIFSDEFEGNNVDWAVWESEDPQVIKHETYRGRENAKVENGELRLYVTKDSRNGSVWSAASIYTRKVLKRNSYVECKFKSTQCTGVNNAFWLACRTDNGGTYNNRYEVDIVEARQNADTGVGKAHLAWHDWKTYRYTKNQDGKNFDIAQGIHVDHSFDEYHTWGLWYGENEIIYYLDGEPVWNGRTHDKYVDQWYTGIGKSPVWNPVEEKRAYGKFGQDDWWYRGGFNGDKMNIILSTLPWGDKSTPLTDSADGTYMAVDYVRVFQPESELNETPLQYMEKVNRFVPLQEVCNLDTDKNYYFGFKLNRTDDNPIQLNMINPMGGSVIKAAISPDGSLFVGMNNNIVSSKTAYPSCESSSSPIVMGDDYYAVIRVTSKSKEKDAVSMKLFKMSDRCLEEPYFYPNIDVKGNTSITNEWTINLKDMSEESLKAIQIAGNWTLSDFCYGKNFLSVLPASWKKSRIVLSDCVWARKKEELKVSCYVEGDAPFEFKYLLGDTEKSITIQEEGYSELSLSVEKNTIIKPLTLVDADSKQGIVEGQACVIVNNRGLHKIFPVFDTYVQNGSQTDFSSYQSFEMKGDSRYEREIYIKFPLDNITKDVTFFAIYNTDNQNGSPVKLQLSVVREDLYPLLVWNTKPKDLQVCGELSVEGTAGKYIGCDVSDIVNAYKKAGYNEIVFALRFKDGDRNNMIKFYQGHNCYDTESPMLFNF